jgi:hypothetical protein
VKLKFHELHGHKRKCSTASHKILSSDSYPSTSQCGLLMKTGVLTFSVRFLWLNTIHHMRGVFSYVQGSPAPSCLHCRRVGFVPIFNGHFFNFPRSTLLRPFSLDRGNLDRQNVESQDPRLSTHNYNFRIQGCPLMSETESTRGGEIAVLSYECDYLT